MLVTIIYNDLVELKGTYEYKIKDINPYIVNKNDEFADDWLASTRRIMVAELGYKIVHDLSEYRRLCINRELDWRTNNEDNSDSDDDDYPIVYRIRSDTSDTSIDPLNESINKMKEYKYDFSHRLVTDYDDTMPTMILGQPCVGKTSAAVFLLDYRCLIIRSIGQLLNFNHRIHDGIVFENVDFREVRIKDLIVLTHRGDRVIIINNIEVLIPKTCQLIFTGDNNNTKYIFPTVKSKSFYNRFTVMYADGNIYIENDKKRKPKTVFLNDN